MLPARPRKGSRSTRKNPVYDNAPTPARRRPSPQKGERSLPREEGWLLTKTVGNGQASKPCGLCLLFYETNPFPSGILPRGPRSPLRLRLRAHVQIRVAFPCRLRRCGLVYRHPHARRRERSPPRAERLKGRRRRPPTRPPREVSHEEATSDVGRARLPLGPWRSASTGFCASRCSTGCTSPTARTSSPASKTSLRPPTREGPTGPSLQLTGLAFAPGDNASAVARVM